MKNENILKMAPDGYNPEYIYSEMGPAKKNMEGKWKVPYISHISSPVYKQESGTTAKNTVKAAERNINSETK